MSEILTELMMSAYIRKDGSEVWALPFNERDVIAVCFEEDGVLRDVVVPGVFEGRGAIRYDLADERKVIKALLAAGGFRLKDGREPTEAETAAAVERAAVRRLLGASHAEVPDGMIDSSLKMVKAQVTVRAADLVRSRMKLGLV